LKNASIVSFLLLMCACSRGEPSSSSRYSFNRSSVLKLAEAGKIQEQLPYESISLSISGSAIEDNEASLDISLSRDGQATCEGYLPGRHVSGKYRGEVHLLDFARICELLEQLRFAELEPRYETGWTHMRTYVLRVRKADATVREVSDYGEAGPIELWAMRAAIEAVASRIEWESVPG
jgi:hypothetical protein